MYMYMYAMYCTCTYMYTVVEYIKCTLYIYIQYMKYGLRGVKVTKKVIISFDSRYPASPCCGVDDGVGGLKGSPDSRKNLKVPS